MPNTTCPTGKRRYRERLNAEHVLAQMTVQRRNRLRRAEQRVYQCPLCNGWHLTSQPKKGEAA